MRNHSAQLLAQISREKFVFVIRGYARESLQIRVINAFSVQVPQSLKIYAIAHLLLGIQK